MFKLFNRAAKRLSASAPLLMPIASFANDGTDANTILGHAISYLTGPIATSLATLAVVGVGVAFLTGRMPKVWAISVIVGVAIIFGAPHIIHYFQQGS